MSFLCCAASLRDEDFDAEAEDEVQLGGQTDEEGAWWSFAGSQPAAVAALVGAAAVLVVAGLKLSGH